MLRIGLKLVLVLALLATIAAIGGGWKWGHHPTSAAKSVAATFTGWTWDG
jgi:ABC-type glycerol-3-phosphate transport system substrate-binding protein